MLAAAACGRQLGLGAGARGGGHVLYEDALGREVEVHRGGQPVGRGAAHADHVHHDGFTVRGGLHHVLAFQFIYFPCQGPLGGFSLGWRAVLAGVEALLHGLRQIREGDTRLGHRPLAVQVLEPCVAFARSGSIGCCRGFEIGDGIIAAHAPCYVRCARVAGLESGYHRLRYFSGTGAADSFVFRTGREPQHRCGR